MTEKEKRDLGQIYNPNYDEELINEMLKAKDLCYEYNNIKPSEIERRKGVKLCKLSLLVSFLRTLFLLYSENSI